MVSAFRYNHTIIGNHGLERNTICQYHRCCQTNLFVLKHPLEGNFSPLTLHHPTTLFQFKFYYVVSEPLTYSYSTNATVLVLKSPYSSLVKLIAHHNYTHIHKSSFRTYPLHMDQCGSP